MYIFREENEGHWVALGADIGVSVDSGGHKSGRTSMKHGVSKNASLYA